MAAEKVVKEEIFMNSVQFVLGNWPAIRVSVEQCFGGQYSSDKETWLQKVIFDVFMENESLDPLDIEDYLAEILSNEFNVIIEDGSLAKVSEKLCNFYDLCKKGQHFKVAEEINSISLPKMNVRYEDKDDDMEVHENGEVAKELGDLSLNENEDMQETRALHQTNNIDVNTNGVTNSNGEVEQHDEGWVVVQRGRKKR